MAKKKPIPAEYRAYAGQPFCITKHYSFEQLKARQYAIASRGRNAFYSGAMSENQSYYGESVVEIYSRNKLIKGFYHVRMLDPETQRYEHIGDVIFAGKQMYTEVPLTRCKTLDRVVREEQHALQLYQEKHGNRQDLHNPQDEG